VGEEIYGVVEDFYYFVCFVGDCGVEDVGWFRAAGVLGIHLHYKDLLSNKYG